MHGALKIFSGNKVLANTTTFKEDFPTLLKHKSGSIFFVVQKEGSNVCFCISKGEKNEGSYDIGDICRPKNFLSFERMREGFFIELSIK